MPTLALAFQRSMQSTAPAREDQLRMPTVHETQRSTTLQYVSHSAHPSPNRLTQQVNGEPTSPDIDTCTHTGERNGRCDSPLPGSRPPYVYIGIHNEAAKLHIGYKTGSLREQKWRAVQQLDRHVHQRPGE